MDLKIFSRSFRLFALVALLVLLGTLAASMAPVNTYAQGGCEGYAEGSLNPDNSRRVCRNGAWAPFEGGYGCFAQSNAGQTYIFPEGAGHPWYGGQICTSRPDGTGYSDWLYKAGMLPTVTVFFPLIISAPAPPPAPPLPPVIYEKTEGGWVRSGGNQAPAFIPEVWGDEVLSLDEAVYRFNRGENKEVEGTRRAFSLPRPGIMGLFSSCKFVMWETRDNYGGMGYPHTTPSGCTKYSWEELKYAYDAQRYYGGLAARRESDAKTAARLKAWWAELGGEGCHKEFEPGGANYAGYYKWIGCDFESARAAKVAASGGNSGSDGSWGLSVGSIPGFGWGIGAMVIVVIGGLSVVGVQQAFAHSAGANYPQPDSMMGAKYVGTVVLLLLFAGIAVAVGYGVGGATGALVGGLGAVVIGIIGLVLLGGGLGWTYSAGTSQYRFPDNGRLGGAISQVVTISFVVLIAIVIVVLVLSVA